MTDKPWVIFDADNTLWHTERIYNNSRTALCTYLAQKGACPEKVEQFQQQRDKELHKTYGYSACRFARSFEDTILHFIHQASPEEIHHARGIALQVFSTQAPVVDGLEHVISNLSERFELGIITAGERWVQQQRLRDFPLTEKFRAVQIVDSKSAQVFVDFCQEHGINRSASWAVGDSVNSDIKPALEAGLRAMLLYAENWHHVEGARETLPAEVPCVTSIRDVEKLLLQS